MNIHLKLTGEAEDIINEMIKRGHAASKTEAVRIAILHYKYCVLDRTPEKCPIVKKNKKAG